MSPRPGTTAAAAVPVDVVEAAHVALHSCWATPSSPVPTGTGCRECLPDLTGLVGALWRHLDAGGSVPPWAIAQAAVTLHNTWSASPIEPGDSGVCLECRDDVEVILGALEPLAAQADDELREQGWLRGPLRRR